MRLGLSGTAGFGRSGTPESDYREREPLEKPQKSARNRPPSNYANRKESFGFLLTARAAVDSAVRSVARAPESRTVSGEQS